MTVHESARLTFKAGFARNPSVAYSTSRRFLWSHSCRFPAPGMMKIARRDPCDWCLIALEAPSGQRPTHTGATEPVLESGPDVDTYPGLWLPAVGKHAEQRVMLLDVPRRASAGGAPWTPCLPR